MTRRATRASPSPTRRQRHAVRQRQRLRRRLLLPSDDAHVRAELAVHARTRTAAPAWSATRAIPACPARRRARTTRTAPPAATATTASAPRPASARWTRTARTSAPNYTCVNNTCVPGTAGGTCKLDKDCAAGRPASTAPAPTRRTRPAAPTTPSAARAASASTAPARTAAATTATCGTGQICSGGHCVNNPSGGRSVHGRTPTAAPTRRASTAPATTTARRRRTARRTDVCVAGVCVANTGRTPQCHNNAECGAGARVRQRALPRALLQLGRLPDVRLGRPDLHDGLLPVSGTSNQTRFLERRRCWSPPPSFFLSTQPRRRCP